MQIDEKKKKKMERFFWRHDTNSFSASHPEIRTSVSRRRTWRYPAATSSRDDAVCRALPAARQPDGGRLPASRRHEGWGAQLFRDTLWRHTHPRRRSLREIYRKHCRSADGSPDIASISRNDEMFICVCRSIYVCIKGATRQYSLSFPLCPVCSLWKAANSSPSRIQAEVLYVPLFWREEQRRWYTLWRAKDGQGETKTKSEKKKEREREGRKGKRVYVWATLASPSLLVGPPAFGTSITTIRGMLSTTARDASRKSLRFPCPSRPGGPRCTGLRSSDDVARRRRRRDARVETPRIDIAFLYL